MTINSAIKVDLTGQVNAEQTGGAYLGGTGGQVEYSNASEAALSVFRYDEAERFLLEATQ